mmetsp:Transcript_107829/g.305034  ORF Transcript_107829/g.305034 Transcript_107829/m.305034 type:complete len:218 (-) Transcript_107829:244-897(-)
MSCIANAQWRSTPNSGGCATTTVPLSSRLIAEIHLLPSCRSVSSAKRLSSTCREMSTAAMSRTADGCASPTRLSRGPSAAHRLTRRRPRTRKTSPSPNGAAPSNGLAQSSSGISQRGTSSGGIFTSATAPKAPAPLSTSTAADAPSRACRKSGTKCTAVGPRPAAASLPSREASAPAPSTPSPVAVFGTGCGTSSEDTEQRSKEIVLLPSSSCHARK